MCDPIGAITLAGAIVATCYSYGCGVADAPQEAKDLTAEVSSLAGLLVGIQAISSSNAGVVTVDNLPQVLSDCQEALQRVSDRLKSQDPDSPASRFRRLKNRALWPLGKDTTMGLLTIVERQKSALSIALGASAVKGIGEQHQLLAGIQDSVNHVSDQLSAMQIAQERAGIVKWLSAGFDFTALHRQATQVYCPNTCAWILENALFKTWLGSCPGTLWLSGSAGSGKTVLTSYVIKYLQSSIDFTGTVVYFHCNANVTETLSTENILGSILSQLCDTEIPLPILKAYRSATGHAGASRAATVEIMRSMLIEMVEHKGDIAVLVDGIDEALNPEDVGELLQSLTGIAASRVRLFLSSRPNTYIEASLPGVAKLIPDIDALDQDIEKYVSKRLADDRRLAKLSENTKSHIHQALVSKSRGMFRWAQCQLDETSRMRSEGAIDAALSSLPKSLQETYQRALQKVHESDRLYLRRALMWLMWSLYPLKLMALVDAIVLEEGMTQFNSQVRLNDPNELLEICGTFAVHQEHFRSNHEAHQVRLAHHSVRDYFSDSVGHDSEFWLPSKSSHRELAILCLTYLLLDDWTRLRQEDIMKEIRQNHLFRYAVSFWPAHVLKSEAELELLPLIGKIMTPTPNEAFMLWMNGVVAYSTTGGYPNHKPEPLYYAASYGLNETVRLLIRQGAELDVQCGGYGGTAAHAACLRNHPEILRQLLDAGVDTNIKDYTGMTAVELAVWCEYSEVVIVLLECVDQSKLNGEIKQILEDIASNKHGPSKSSHRGHLRRRPKPAFPDSSELKS